MPRPLFLDHKTEMTNRSKKKKVWRKLFPATKCAVRLIINTFSQQSQPLSLSVPGVTVSYLTRVVVYRMSRAAHMSSKRKRCSIITRVFAKMCKKYLAQMPEGSMKQYVYIFMFNSWAIISPSC